MLVTTSSTTTTHSNRRTMYRHMAPQPFARRWWGPTGAGPHPGATRSGDGLLVVHRHLRDGQVAGELVELELRHRLAGHRDVVDPQVGDPGDRFLHQLLVDVGEALVALVGVGIGDLLALVDVGVHAGDSDPRGDRDPQLLRLLRRQADQRVVGVPGADDRAAVEQGPDERVRVGVVLAPAGVQRDRDLVLDGLDSGVGGAGGQLTRLHLDADLVQAGGHDRLGVGERRHVAVDHDEVGALLGVADPVLVAVVLGLLHLLLGLGLVATVALGGIRVVVGAQLVAKDDGREVVGGDLTDRRAAPGLQDALLVHDVVGGLADVDVVERRRDPVHGDVPGPVAGVDVQVRLLGRVGQVLLQHRLGRLVADRGVELAGLDLAEDVVDVGVDLHGDAVDVVGPQVVRGLVVVGVADQGDLLARIEPRDRLHRVAGRDVELVGALEHVGPGGHHVAAVVTGLLEALADLFGDRRGGRHADPVQEAAGRLLEVEDDRLVVGRLDARDLLVGRLGLAVHALDDAVVPEAVLGDQGGGVDPLEGVGDVLGGDVAVQRRRPLDARLQLEGVLQAVRGDLWGGRGQVGDDLVAWRAGDMLIAHQGPLHRPVQADGDGDVLAGRVEAVGEAEVADGRAEHAALLGGGLLPATTAAFVVTATTRRGHQGQGEGKSHQTSLLSSLAHQSSLLADDPSPSLVLEGRAAASFLASSMLTAVWDRVRPGGRHPRG